MLTDGGSLDLEIDGRVYRVARVGLEIHFEAADRVCRLRDDRLRSALETCRHLSGEQFESAVSMAFDRHQKVITNQDVADWLDSLDGAAFLFARALAGAQPDITEAEARRLYQRLAADQLRAVGRFLSQSFASPQEPRQQPTENKEAQS